MSTPAFDRRLRRLELMHCEGLWNALLGVNRPPHESREGWVSRRAVGLRWLCVDGKWVLADQSSR